MKLPTSLDQLQNDLRDRYSLEGEVGRGGMATVYRARDLRHDRLVALKVMHPELAATLGLERFLREIKTAARLQHPHILSVHDSGEAAGQLWFTMPFVEGESLRDRLRREKQLAIDEALCITREAAQALQYAHTHGVIHRDIKPENLLLTEDGNTLVADFGVARALQGGDALTQTGLAVGTPAYMSPEQASGARDLDARSDVYALATVLYEMLAGEPPFAGPTPQAALARRFTEPPRPLRQVRETVPEVVEQAVAKALAKAPADRFPSAAEFARALAGPVLTTPVPTTAVTGAPVRVSRHRLPPLALALGLGFLIGLGVLFAWRRSRTAAGGAAAREKVLAVLPFENLGAAQDEYFADGLADAVRGKLALLAGVEVIARESSAPYRKTSKPPEQVARELGARYLLTGTVRWEKAPGGAGRVVVSPELVEVTPGNSPRARWQQPFAAALTDVFQVQGQIAGQVAQALDVALASSERRALEARPTADPTAYDYYLRGNVYFDRGNAEPDLRAAEELYSKAVALDSAFALAHARLALTHDLLYWFTYDRSPERLSKEKASADRAIRLRPDLAEAHLALGYYHYHGHLDYERALAEFEAARRLQPSNADVHFAIGLVRRRQGRWPEAVRHLRQSVELNPRSVTNLVDLANTHLSMRAYAEAESIFVRAVEIAPDNGLANALKAALPLLWRGDTLEAERRVREALVRAGPERGLRSLFQPKFMVSSGIQSILYDTALVRESRAAFGSDTALYFRWWAGFHAYHGRREAAQAYFDSTRAVLQRQADRQPEEPRFHARLALVNENLGRLAEARSEAQRAVDLGPVSQDALGGAGYRELLARMLVRTGEAEAAVDQLAYLLSVPSSTSVAFLRIDPAFAPLRSNPRFQRLLGGA